MKKLFLITLLRRCYIVILLEIELGYGKGFYDKFFQTINFDAKKIGVNYFAPTDIIDDISELDVKLDYLITPDEILSFSGISMLTK